MCLFSGQNFDEVLKIGDTSARDELEQPVVAVTWLCNVDDMFSLWPRDTSGSRQLGDKGVVGVDSVE